MPEPELCLLFLRPLNRLGTRYIVSGSVAAILYGEPRLTHDVDLVVFLRSEDVIRLREVFPPPEFSWIGEEGVDGKLYGKSRSGV